MELPSLGFDLGCSELVRTETSHEANARLVASEDRIEGAASDSKPCSLRGDLTASSPSLGQSFGAFELKFLVNDDCAQTIKKWARDRLAADPHADRNLDGCYLVNTLYLDTSDFQTFHQARYFCRRKFRVRRYGREPSLWLELNRKQNSQVRKRRVRIAEPELAEYLAELGNEESERSWFRRRLERRHLKPACQITYCRFARVGTSSTGPVRLTIDRGLSARGAEQWRIPDAPLPEQSLLNGRQIVEMKFREVLPASFRSLIHKLRLQPTTFSKYREAVAACVPMSQLTGEGS